MPLVLATVRRLPATGADTGRMGLRRRPGQAASAVPIAMIPPPIHSHMISGWTMMPMVAGSPAFWGASTRVRYRSSRGVDLTEGVPTGVQPPLYWLIAGR